MVCATASPRRSRPSRRRRTIAFDGKQSSRADPAGDRFPRPAAAPRAMGLATQDSPAASTLGQRFATIRIVRLLLSRRAEGRQRDRATRGGGRIRAIVRTAAAGRSRLGGSSSAALRSLTIACAARPPSCAWAGTAAPPPVVTVPLVGGASGHALSRAASASHGGCGRPALSTKRAGSHPIRKHAHHDRVRDEAAEFLLAAQRELGKQVRTMPSVACPPSGTLGRTARPRLRI